MDGKYEIVAPLGRGGMARVWLGRDMRLDKLWAIKEIAPGAGGASDGVAASGMALRRSAIDEAQFMKRLDHPLIPRVVDICDEGDAVFVVMDFVNGRSLGRALRERGRPFACEEVVSWALALCDVLGYLHSLTPPVVYRDLKPDNVMLRDDGSIRLVDFGISCELRQGSEEGERMVGTPGYAAPEQLERGRPCDERSDVFALGVTMYSLLSGHVPRPLGGGAADFVIRPLRSWDPSLPEGLERVVWHATRQEPDERQQSVVELRYDLEHHEELTRGYRERLQRRVRSFHRRVVAAGVAAAAAVACAVGAATLHEVDYEELVRVASLASDTEQAAGEVGGEGETASERGWTAALVHDPARIEPWRRLVTTYKADLAFTPSEAARWSALFVAHGRAVEADPGYARLCFDMGVLYLCYYGAVPSGGRAEVGEQSAGIGAGLGALVAANARRSAEWFARAREAADVGGELDDVAYRAAGAYLVIAEFHDRVSQATYEGAGGAEAYRGLWSALDETVRTLSATDEVAVRLRLYQVAFEALASPTYLRGFWRAGVGREEAEDLLSAIVRRTRALADDVEQNEVVLGPIYREITGGVADVRENLESTFDNPVAVGMEAF